MYAFNTISEKRGQEFDGYTGEFRGRKWKKEMLQLYYLKNNKEIEFTGKKKEWWLSLMPQLLGGVCVQSSMYCGCIY